MTNVRIEAGLLTCSRDDRTVSGLLLPFGEVGRTGLGRFSVEPGIFSVPADPIIVGLDVEHEREMPVGRATDVHETPEGIVATFTIARTPEGDQALDEIESGERRSLSAEVADVVIRAGKAVAGRLFGAAVCKQGAFPSATLYASDVGDLPDTAIIAAVPVPDSPGLDGVEEPHVTMAYLGPAEGLDVDSLLAAVKGVAGSSDPVTDEVMGRATLGVDGADVVLLDARGLAPIRDALVANQAVADAMACVEQFPVWVPHLTLGYPGDDGTYSGDPPESIAFDALQLWVGPDRYPFALEQQPSDQLAASGEPNREGATVPDTDKAAGTLDAALTVTTEETTVETIDGDSDAIEVETVTTIEDGETVDTITEVVSQEITYEQEPAGTTADATDASATTEEGATVPETLTASVPAGSLAARTAERINKSAPSRSTLFASLAQAYQTGGKSTLLAALADVTTADILGAEQPQWLGELWSGRAYRRRIAPLVNEAPLTSRKLLGWRFTTKPVVAAYDGDKAAVPSGDVVTEEVSLTASRLAVGHDIDRAFVDFGETSFFDAYFRAVNESYARVSDAAFFSALETGAGAAATVGTVPTGVGLGWAMVVDGALSVLSDTDEPATFALVDPALYRGMLLTRNDDVLPLLSAALDVEEGSVFSQFKLLPWSGVTTGQVLVGTKAAATIHELGGGTPIRVEAQDLVNGGVDKAAFGYYAVNIHDAGGLALIDDGIG